MQVQMLLTNNSIKSFRVGSIKIMYVRNLTFLSLVAMKLQKKEDSLRKLDM